MKNEEIVQVLEQHLDCVRDLYRHYRERNGASEETAARMEATAREAEALACAVHIVGLYADDGIPLERLSDMGGKPVFIVSRDEDPHWELSADGADYLEGRDPRQYGTEWVAFAHPFKASGLDARDRETLCAALSKWGADAQTVMVFEEMAELQKALCKHERGVDNRDDIAEEIADVRIMLDQMELLHDCGGLCVRYREEKMDRLRRRVRGCGDA